MEYGLKNPKVVIDGKEIPFESLSITIDKGANAHDISITTIDDELPTRLEGSE